ncbi:MAG: hypothetical protein PHH74_07755, partial [Candidatus Cloacimonetes bacterium]|nr:hypothetical protein [Candidatus Cloacimonadota bacterium]
ARQLRYIFKGMDTGHPGCVRRLLPKNLAKDAPFYAGYGKTKNRLDSLPCFDSLILRRKND